jgi:hypothetical protein
VAAEKAAAREAELAARDAARRRLMAEVDAVRQQQIALKRGAAAAALAAKAADRVEAEAAAAAEAAEAEARRQARLKGAVSQRLEIQTQMVAKAHIRAAEEDEKLRAVELAADAETQYIGRVTQVLGKTDPPTWCAVLDVCAACLLCVLGLIMCQCCRLPTCCLCPSVSGHVPMLMLRVLHDAHMQVWAQEVQLVYMIHGPRFPAHTAVRWWLHILLQFATQQLL